MTETEVLLPNLFSEIAQAEHLCKLTNVSLNLGSLCILFVLATFSQTVNQLILVGLAKYKIALLKLKYPVIVDLLCSIQSKGSLPK